MKYIDYMKKNHQDYYIKNTFSSASKIKKNETNWKILYYFICFLTWIKPHQAFFRVRNKQVWFEFSAWGIARVAGCCRQSVYKFLRWLSDEGYITLKVYKEQSWVHGGCKCEIRCHYLCKFNKKFLTLPFVTRQVKHVLRQIQQMEKAIQPLALNQINLNKALKCKSYYNPNLPRSLRAALTRARKYWQYEADYAPVLQGSDYARTWVINLDLVCLLIYQGTYGIYKRMGEWSDKATEEEIQLVEKAVNNLMARQFLAKEKRMESVIVDYKTETYWDDKNGLMIERTPVYEERMAELIIANRYQAKCNAINGLIDAASGKIFPNFRKVTKKSHWSMLVSMKSRKIREAMGATFKERLEFILKHYLYNVAIGKETSNLENYFYRVQKKNGDGIINVRSPFLTAMYHYIGGFYNAKNY